MFMMACLAQMIVGDLPQSVGDDVLLRGDNVSAVSWVSKRGGAKIRRAGLLRRLVGRKEITSGWCHIAKHIAGVDNTLADSISRWPVNEVHENVAS